jgi:hypothetical protein
MPTQISCTSGAVHAISVFLLFMRESAASLFARLEPQSRRETFTRSAGRRQTQPCVTSSTKRCRRICSGSRPPPGRSNRGLRLVASGQRPTQARATDAPRASLSCAGTEGAALASAPGLTYSCASIRPTAGFDPRPSSTGPGRRPFTAETPVDFRWARPPRTQPSASRRTEQTICHCHTSHSGHS